MSIAIAGPAVAAAASIAFVGIGQTQKGITKVFTSEFGDFLKLFDPEQRAELLSQAALLDKAKDMAKEQIEDYISDVGGAIAKDGVSTILQSLKTLPEGVATTATNTNNPYVTDVSNPPPDINTPYAVSTEGFADPNFSYTLNCDVTSEASAYTANQAAQDLATLGKVIGNYLIVQTLKSIKKGSQKTLVGALADFIIPLSTAKSPKSGKEVSEEDSATLKLSHLAVVTFSDKMLPEIVSKICETLNLPAPETTVLPLAQFLEQLMPSLGISSEMISNAALGTLGIASTLALSVACDAAAIVIKRFANMDTKQLSAAFDTISQATRLRPILKDYKAELERLQANYKNVTGTSSLDSRTQERVEFLQQTLQKHDKIEEQHEAAKKVLENYGLIKKGPNPKKT